MSRSTPTEAADRFTTAQRELARKGVALTVRPGEYEIRIGKNVEVIETLDDAIARGRELAGLQAAITPVPEDSDAAIARVRKAAIPERPITIRELRNKIPKYRTPMQKIRARIRSHNFRVKIREALCPSSAKTTPRD